MALVFRCDGCGRLEGHDPRNKWQSEKAGSVTFIKEDKFDSNRDDRPVTTKDLCKSCCNSFEQWVKNLGSHAPQGQSES